MIETQMILGTKTEKLPERVRHLVETGVKTVVIAVDKNEQVDIGKVKGEFSSVNIVVGEVNYLSREVLMKGELGALKRIGDTRYVLVEADRKVSSTGFKMLLELVLWEGYIPVVLSVEDYHEVYKDLHSVAELAKAGVVFHVNIENYVGFGKKSWIVRSFLNIGVIELISIRKHNLRVYNKGYDRLKRNYSEHRSNVLIEENLVRIINNEELGKDFVVEPKENYIVNRLRNRNRLVTAGVACVAAMMAVVVGLGWSGYFEIAGTEMAVDVSINDEDVAAGGFLTETERDLLVNACSEQLEELKANYDRLRNKADSNLEVVELKRDADVAAVEITENLRGWLIDLGEDAGVADELLGEFRVWLDDVE